MCSRSIRGDKPFAQTINGGAIKNKKFVNIDAFT